MTLSWPKFFQLTTGFNVKSGPFRGMQYITAVVGSALWPKLLGTYELELWRVVEEIITSRPDLIVNAGAAEGYYSVGFALRSPEARIVSFEINPEGSRLQDLLALRNRVHHRIDAQSLCDTGTLEKSLAGASRPVVVADLEGSEVEILDPAKCPALRRARILVELHAVQDIDVESLLRARFGATHTIERIASRKRLIADLPVELRLLRNIGFERVMQTMEEGRGDGMVWLYLRPSGSQIAG